MMGVITALEIQKRNKERVNVFIDGEYAFSLTLIEAARLKKGQQLTEQDIAELCRVDDVHRAVDHAVRFLSYRPRSGKEVRNNLSKKFDEVVIEAAIERLNALGYLDDEAFAKYWVENRHEFNPRGVMALRYELRQKGIAESIIQSVLDSYDTYDAAYRAAQNKVRSLKVADRQTFYQKVGSYLQRRGFAYDVIRDVLQQLENELTFKQDDEQD
ncbi:MAG: RecX family transcriptional regulator [Phototrophicales bacterium]|nr:MAG: RecX family transcriptional regulator [Phototrophicales bacterium]RMG70949.1 MAG: RecX family transcriptional regulator [Chloroflexota bacterium]